MTDAESKSSVKNRASEEIEDPVESMLKKTGCTELHYKVQVSCESFDLLETFHRTI